MHYVSTQGFFLNLFACKGPSPFCNSSKRRNHLKPVSLETVFLLSALKMLTKSATSYQAEKQQLEEAQLSFDFLSLQPYIRISKFKCVLISLLVIKSFVSLKIDSLHFRTRILFKGGGGSQVPPKIEGGCSYKGWMTDLEFLEGGLGQVKRGEVNISWWD